MFWLRVMNVFRFHVFLFAKKSVISSHNSCHDYARTTMGVKKGLFQKKINRGVEDMEFPRVSNNWHVEFPGIN